MNHSKAIALFFICLLVTVRAVARRYEDLREWPYLLSLSGNLQFISTSADGISGASYSKKFTNSYVGSAALGARLFHHIYLGVRYEDWLAQQTYSLSATATTNTLKWQTLGAEIGWYAGNPRVYWIVMGGVGYPLRLELDSQSAATSVYTFSKKPLEYIARGVIGFKFESWIALEFSGGYRYAYLGHPICGTTPLLSTGGALNFSGPFVGAGLAFHF